jgi:hypothetical protein
MVARSNTSVLYCWILCLMVDMASPSSTKWLLLPNLHAWKEYSGCLGWRRQSWHCEMDWWRPLTVLPYDELGVAISMYLYSPVRDLKRETRRLGVEGCDIRQERLWPRSKSVWQVIHEVSNHTTEAPIPVASKGIWQDSTRVRSQMVTIPRMESMRCTTSYLHPDSKDTA